MGVQLDRKKKRILMLSFAYVFKKLLPLSAKSKLKLFLNLEWIFDRLAHEESFNYYDPSIHPVRIKSKEFILNGITPNDVVLDLGCNLGDISYLIAEKANEVVGIDYNNSAIIEASKRYNRSNLIFLNAEALEYLSTNAKKFDTLILSHILEHLDEPKKFLLDFKNYFSKIYIELPDFERYYLNNYRKDLKLPLIYSDTDHINEFDRDDIFNMLTECGLTIEKSEYRYGLQKLWCKVG